MPPKVHPVAEIFPLMDAEAFARLKADIEANGQREPTVYWKGMLVDGRNRERACQELGIEPSECELLEETDPVAFILSANVHRRHLTTTQRAITAARLATLSEGRPKANSPKMDGFSLEGAAELFGVSRSLVASAKRVIRFGCDELVALCEADVVKVTAAVDFIAGCQDQREQAAICQRGVEAIEERIIAWRLHARDGDEAADAEPEPPAAVETEPVETAPATRPSVAPSPAAEEPASPGQVVDHAPQPVLDPAAAVAPRADARGSRRSPTLRPEQPRQDPEEIVHPAAMRLPERANEITVAFVDRWLERQDERSFVERLRALWDAADVTGRAAMRAFLEDDSHHETETSK